MLPPLYESKADRATYLQYEYFNYHMNKTVSTLAVECWHTHSEAHADHLFQFFWDNICMLNHQDLNDCLPNPEETADGFYLLKKSRTEWCRIWGGNSRGRSFDGAWATLCFGIHLYLDMNTEIKFNGQKRNLGMQGSQKWVDVPGNEARRVCDVVCPQQADMPRMEDNPLQRSLQWTYELDDMCHGCK